MEEFKDTFRNFNGKDIRIRTILSRDPSADISRILTLLYIDSVPLVLSPRSFNSNCREMIFEELRTLIIIRYIFALKTLVGNTGFFFLGFHLKGNLIKWFNQCLEWPGVKGQLSNVRRVGFVSIHDGKPPIVECTIYDKSTYTCEHWALDLRSVGPGKEYKKLALKIGAAISQGEWNFRSYPPVSGLSVGKCTLLDLGLLVIIWRALGIPDGLLAYSDVLGQDNAAKVARRQVPFKGSSDLEKTEVSALQFSQWATKRVLNCLQNENDIKNGIPWSDSTIGAIADLISKCTMVGKEKTVIKRKLLAPLVSLASRDWQSKLLRREAIHLQEISRLALHGIRTIRENLRTKEIDIRDPFAVEKYMKTERNP